MGTAQQQKAMKLSYGELVLIETALRHFFDNEAVGWVCPQDEQVRLNANDVCSLVEKLRDERAGISWTDSCLWKAASRSD